MTTYDPCRNCGKPILVIIQRGSGFCRPDCEEEWENEGGAVKDED